MKPVLVISDRDNVATALEQLTPGRRLDLEGVALTVSDMIPPGHKVALQAIAAGAEVIKYGSPIGTATRDITPGMHVHTHNVASSRGRGDLNGPPLEPEARLAEPPEVASAAPIPPEKDEQT